MTKWVVMQVIGVAAFVIGVQGAIRLLLDHTNTGLMSWAPGGFGGALAADIVLIAAGGWLAWRGDSRRRAP